MSAPTAKLADTDHIMERLEDQLAWYDRKSMANQRVYKRIKVVEILAAAIILFCQSLGVCTSPSRPASQRQGSNE
jgi:hypothetical protein